MVRRDATSRSQGRCNAEAHDIARQRLNNSGQLSCWSSEPANVTRELMLPRATGVRGPDLAELLLIHRLRWLRLAYVFMWLPMSVSSPNASRSQPQKVIPPTGAATRMYMRVVHGKKISPSNGQTNVVNERWT
jgi:hypothetical protein